jgi:hypothetical protein
MRLPIEAFPAASARQILPLAVDGRVVVAVHDAHYPKGGVGVLVESFGGKQMKARFDNLVVYKP